ncbi:hypothetical protein I2485_10925 [Nesterenkonia sp. E16_7]|uniref:hypothetical protein n=1 Tax=unclassified Nesterenkonia TaxID=2629769 RepID=UPI001A92DD82|nr:MULTISPECIES: hypothetical protein [unclassified Nesterenkonia]MBO0595395.1 hypothetical protein [Nesterenkonia sp. E16_10]MBO0599157.1 hypothetical protein [Nesterenkonia sp. E16_7]
MKKSSANAKLMGTAATGFFAQQTASMVKGHAFDDSGKLTPRAETWLTRAVTVQRPLVLANLRRLRKAHPGLSNRALAAQLDKDFTRAMTGGGALIGATAAVPAVGTVTSLGLSAAATGSFLEACALYAQSIAELSGISTADPERAKLLVMGVMLGDQGRKLLGELSQQAGGKGTGPFSSLVPMNISSSSTGVSGLVVNQIKRQFMRRFFIRSGTSMLARAIPFGIGMVVGGAANHRLASQIVKSAHKTFGELPEQTPAALAADMERALERERLRAERKARRGRKREILAERRSKSHSQDETPAEALETSRATSDAKRP